MDKAKVQLGYRTFGKKDVEFVELPKDIYSVAVQLDDNVRFEMFFDQNTNCVQVYCTESMVVVPEVSNRIGLQVRKFNEAD